MLVEKAASDAATLDSLVALVDNREMDQIGLTPSAMHAIWTLAGLADTGNAAARQALQAACGKGFQHPSSPVRDCALACCDPTQIKQAIELKLHQDPDPRVQLTLLLRIADGKSNDVKHLDSLLSSLVQGERSIAGDDILLDAWTAAAATQSIPALIAVINSREVSQIQVCHRA